MRPDDNQIGNYLTGCRELVAFSDQGGWFEPDTICFRIAEEREDSLLLAVQYEEVVMEASGCCATRLDRFGYLRLFLSPTGGITGAKAE